MKHAGRVVGAVLVAALVLAFASCDILGLFGTYTIKVTNYSSTSIYTIKYRTSGDTEWKTLDFVNEDGESVMAFGSIWDDSYVYVDMPGKGTYDFSVYDVLGDMVASVSDVTIDLEIDEEWDYLMTLGSDYELEVV